MDWIRIVDRSPQLHAVHVEAILASQARHRQVIPRSGDGTPQLGNTRRAGFSGKHQQAAAWVTRLQIKLKTTREVTGLLMNEHASLDRVELSPELIVKSFMPKAQSGLSGTST